MSLFIGSQEIGKKKPKLFYWGDLMNSIKHTYYKGNTKKNDR